MFDCRVRTGRPSWWSRSIVGAAAAQFDPRTRLVKEHAAMTEPRKDDFAKENTDYIGDPVVSGEDVLSNTPSPDEESGVGDYLAEDDNSAGMKEDPLQGRPAAT
jgi:hypothetical protein